MKNVYFVGKIDLEIFRAIFGDIQTDEVIITEERIAHIKANHPGDFEKYGKYIRSIIEKPDFILSSDLPNTALLLKSFSENGTRLKLILRFKVSSDPREYKNSVLTFQYVEEKRYDRYKKSEKVLYKRE